MAPQIKRIKVKYTLLIIICTLALGNFNNAYAQIYEGKNFELNTTMTGDKTYVAQDYIKLLPGFFFQATASDHFHAYVNKNLIVDAQYGDLFDYDDVANRNLNYNLPAGSIAGTHSVSPTGAATYTIPIAVPPGTNGMQPTVAVTYNSQAGNGLLGWGWNLSGLSAITRAPQTFYHNEKVSPVQLNNNDWFALDGNRLIATNGSYGINGTIYGTEVETFSRITSHGQVGNGPEWFEVETKGGQTLEYGRTTDARVEINTGSTSTGFIWRINKITDNLGNYILFQYNNSENEGNESRITTISYTHNDGAGLASYNAINFYYDYRTDKNTVYMEGVGINSTVLLREIEITYEDKPIRNYKFQYGYNKYSFLTEIIEQGSDGSELNSSRIQYGDEVIPFSSAASNYIPGQGGTEVFPGDFNGDGKTDLLAAIFTYKDFVKYHTGWKVYLNNSGVFTYLDEGPLPLYYHEVMKGTELPNSLNFVNSDFNGDGKEDFLVIDKYHDGNYLRLNSVTIYTLAGSNFTSETINISTYNIISLDQNYFYTGDFDGDGATDFLTILSNGTSYQARIHFPRRDESKIISNGSSLWAIADQIHVTDFNGDGKNELMVTDEYNTTIYDFDINSSDITANSIYSSGYPTKDHVVHIGDFNGDGKTDLLASGDQPYNWAIGYSTGKYFDEKPINYYLNTINHIGVGDYNGDGKSDILYEYNPYNEIRVYFSLGQTFTSQSHGYTENLGSVSSGDFNGDGKLDIMNIHSVSYPADILSFYPNQKERLVKTIANGMNHLTTFSYKPLSYGQTFYTKGSGGNYPVIDFQGGLHVIHYTIISDGVGGTTAGNTYSYEGARIHKQGKGFLGFSKITTTDNPTGIKSINTYDHDPTYFNVTLEKTETRTAADDLISETTFTNEVKHFGNKRIFPYISQSVANDNLKGITTTTIYTYYNDEYGNLQATEVFHDMDATTVNLYEYEQVEAWCPSKIKKATLLKIRPAESSTRITDFQYYPNGLLWQQITDTGKAKSVTTTYSNYDAFGNPGTIQTAASGLTTRSTTLEYDTKGRFLTKETNVLGHVTEMQYDNKWGKLTGSKDPNGHITSYEYDGFGRLTKTILSTGQEINHDVDWSSGTGPQYALYYSQETSPKKPTSKTYYDVLGRALRQEVEGFDGTSIYTDTEYNNKGQVSQVSEPYFAGDSPQWITHSYDDYGRVTAIVAPGATTTYTYNLRTTTTTTAGQIFSKTIDALGKLSSATDDAGGTVSYTYHSSGKPKQITAPGSTVSMEYDDYWRQTQLVDPDAGTINYVYNAFSELTSQADPLHTTTMQYDQLGRIISKTNSQGVTSYVYDTQPNGIGLLSSVTGPNGISKTFTYDTYSRLSQKTETIDAAPYTKTYTYDNDGNVSTVTYPSGFGITHEYNNYGYLLKIKKADDLSLIWEAQQFNARGQIEQYHLGNNLTTTRTYDQYGFPETIKTGTVQDLEYDFDPTTGNLNYRKDLKHVLTENFSYDNLNRLTNSTVQGQTPITITYDAQVAGNILTKSDAGDYTHAQNAGPHAVTSIANNAGNISSLQQDITYTPFNKVSVITEGNYEMQFTYGPENNRKKVQLSENSVLQYTRYYLGNYEKIVTGANTKELHYIAASDGLVAICVMDQTSRDGAMYYIHKDHLGSFQSITDANGALAEELSFDPWGRRRNPTNWTYSSVPATFLFDRGFTGHEHISEFTLINMNGRVYDPVLGSFLSPDNYVQMPDFTQNFNRYAYCLNNPLVYTDPSGEFFWAALPLLTKIAIGVGAGIGAYTGYKIGEAKGSSGLGMLGYMLGGAVIGGASGYLGATIAAGGGFMANTAGIMASSTINSMFMPALSGGMIQPGISFGFGSFNLGTGKFNYLFDGNNGWYEDLGYAFGALANIQDIVAGVHGGNVDVKSYHTGKNDDIAHSTVENNNRSINISVANRRSIPAKGTIDWARKAAVLNNKWGAEHYILSPAEQHWSTTLQNVNVKWLTTMTNRISQGKGMWGIGNLNWGLFDGCVQHSAYALWGVGIPTLPINVTPVILNIQLAIRQAGIYSSPYLLNFY